MNALLNPAAAPVTMTSREIAELVESRHDTVKIAMERLAEKGLIAFTSVAEKSSGGRPGTEYQVGKRDSYVVVAQLSPEFTARLVDRWQELETQVAHQTPAVPASFAHALRLAADQAEQIELQQAQLAIAAPKVAFVDRYVEATGLKGFREVCKLLKANEARFRDYLIDSKIMYRLAGTLTAHQNHIDAGRFDVRTGVSDTEHAFTATKFTAKGVDWIAGEWAKHQLHTEVA